MEEFTKSEFRKIKLMTGEEYIKVSELKAWCEERIKKENENLFMVRQQFMPTNDDILFESKTIGSIDTLNDLLARFCKGASHD